VSHFARRDARNAIISATLSDGAASRAMVLDDADYGRHARQAAATLMAHAEKESAE
jgi:hypothetical protein